MKHQYFGDINDYKKYGLIRALTGGSGLRTGVIWMLTANDGRSDGNITAYLRKPEEWRRFDSKLFDALHHCLHIRSRRSVDLACELRVLPRASYVEEMLTDDAAARTAYIARALKSVRNCELAFFDPDNGMEVASVPKSSRGSSKYIYPDELARAYAEGHSLLVYQHFPRTARVPYIRGRMKQLRTWTAPARMTAFSTSRVAFFLVPRPEHAEFFAERAVEVGRQWEGVISLIRE